MMTDEACDGVSALCGDEGWLAVVVSPSSLGTRLTMMEKRMS
jgi:hypothetical protein